MLEIPPEGRSDEGWGLMPLQGLARVGLGRPQLQAEGLVAEEVERLYQLLFVYSIGLQHSVQQNLKRLTDAKSEDKEKLAAAEAAMKAAADDLRYLRAVDRAARTSRVC